MSFQYSAQNIRVDDGHILRAQLQDGEGEWRDAEFDLDQIIGNDNGECGVTRVLYSDLDLN